MLPLWELFIYQYKFYCIFIIFPFTSVISYIIIYINKAVNTNKLKGYTLDTQQNTGNTAHSFMNNLIQEVVIDESSSEILKLRADNDEIDSFLRTLSPSSEKELLAFETLSNVQAENIKRIAFLYTLNFNKTNSNIRENVEI